MRARTLAVVVAVLGVVAVTGATAFTTATVERSATIDVAADDSGIIGLNDGTVDGAQISGDTLVINGEKSAEPGLNTEANFTFGDSSSATAASSEHAFTIVNSDDVTHTFNFSFTGSSAVTLDVAHDGDDDGTVDTVTTVGPADEAISLTASETAYVVVAVDTAGVTPSGSDEITATLRIEAN